MIGHFYEVDQIMGRRKVKNKGKKTTIWNIRNSINFYYYNYNAIINIYFIY